VFKLFVLSVLFLKLKFVGITLLTLSISVFVKIYIYIFYLYRSDYIFFYAIFCLKKSYELSGYKISRNFVISRNVAKLLRIFELTLVGLGLVDDVAIFNHVGV
jgi:hypothetical protein